MNALLLTLLACSTPPASIQAQDTLNVFNGNMIKSGAVALTSAGETLTDVPVLATGSSAPDVVKVGNGGEFKCASSGTSTVTLGAGDVSKDIQVTCLLVKEVKVVPKRYEVVLTRGAEGQLVSVQKPALQVQVIAPDGSEMDGAPIQYSSTKADVVSTSAGTAVEFKTSGKAEMKVTVGDKTTSVPVTVWEEVVSKVALKVADGEGHGVPLTAGDYKVTIGSDQPVSVEFLGTECSSPEGKEHSFTCTLDKASNLRVENAGLMGMGGGTATIKLRVLKS